MTTDEQYVPSEALLRIAWSDYCQSMDACNAWVRPDGVDPRAEFDRFLARVRRDAQKDILTTARAALAGEDTVEWARGAHSSCMSYPHAIGIMDDLIEDLDEEVSP